MDRNAILERLNAPTMAQRLNNLREILAAETSTPEAKPQYANNHIHTKYSFSPYSPTAAVYFARAEGLTSCGIMDHDSIGGAEEFRAAGEIAGMAVTCGMEVRTDWSMTPFGKVRLNNPDQDGVAYMALHGVTKESTAPLQAALAPYRKARNRRNRAMVEKINAIIAPTGIVLDFDRDVIPLSWWNEGGSVTERHLLYALGEKVIEAVGMEGVVDFVEQKLQLPLGKKQRAQLSDPANPHFRYDLLGVFKAQLVEQMYIPATDELISLPEVVRLANELGVTLCYAYLGDVGNSVTGDKKAQAFEDSYLDELFAVLKQYGVRGVTYMPSRNTIEQMTRLQGLCRQYGMTEISGEDVNSSRQSFICKQLEQPQFAHLVDATWRLIEIERGTARA